MKCIKTFLEKRSFLFRQSFLCCCEGCEGWRQTAFCKIWCNCTLSKLPGNYGSFSGGIFARFSFDYTKEQLSKGICVSANNIGYSRHPQTIPSMLTSELGQVLWRCKSRMLVWFEWFTNWILPTTKFGYDVLSSAFLEIMFVAEKLLVFVLTKFVVLEMCRNY